MIRPSEVSFRGLSFTLELTKKLLSFIQARVLNNIGISSMCSNAKTSVFDFILVIILLIFII
jgi:hypothetical protein